MNEASCIGKDGVVQVFSYTVGRNFEEDEWCYRFRSIPPPESGAAFEITVKSISVTEVRVIAMYRNDDVAYAAKGIPDYGILLIACELQKIVCSSPSFGGAGVYRTAEATKAWKRLVQRGVALYSEGEDIYRTLPVAPD